MKDNKKIKEIAIKSALIAGEILRTGFGTCFNIENKEGKNNLVTEYDIRAQEAIIKSIKAEFPSHIFLAEEENEDINYDPINATDEVRWIIDPLDGTVNFAHSIPIFSVSIAAELHNEVICGVIYQPLLNELFVAEKGKGALLNDQPIYVTKNADLDTAFCVTGFPYSVEYISRTLNFFTHFVKNGNPVRRLGSAALDLAYVAAGRFDFFWEERLNPWDVAAGKLLVEEAGGKITQYNGEEYSIFDKNIIATNGLLHNHCINILNK